MRQIIQPSFKFENTLAHSFWGEVTQLCTMQEVIQSSWNFEKALAHSFRGKASQVWAMQLLNHPKKSSWNTLYDTHWGKASSMQPVRTFFNYIKRSEAARNDPLWRKGSEMSTVQLCKHHNWPIDNPHEECTYWRKAIPVWPVQPQFCFIRWSAKTHKITHRIGKDWPVHCSAANMNIQYIQKQNVI